MRSFGPVHSASCRLAIGFCALLFGAAPAPAQQPSTEELVSAVVRIKTFIDPDARTLRNLGREREGSGIVIDHDGLIVTIGYLMVEAHAAEVVTAEGRTVAANVVGYDHESGFGLLRALTPLKVRPMALGTSKTVKEREPLVIASHGGVERAALVRVAARREFAGSWEYLLDDAIFTTPPHPAWSGAALVTREGKLVGVGSLIVGDAGGKGEGMPGNMFVPIDLLPPILGDLIANGRVAGPTRPWLGVTAEEVAGSLVVLQVAPDGPAQKAGLRRGDTIAGVNGEAVSTLAGFYRKVWARGRAGASVPLDVRRGDDTRRVDVQSMDRLDHLRLKSSL